MTPPPPFPALAFIPGKKREEQRGGGEGPVSLFSSLLPPFTKIITSHHHSDFIEAFSVRSREVRVPLAAGALRCSVPKRENLSIAILQPTLNHSSQPSLCFAIPSVLSGSRPPCVHTTSASAGTALRWKWVSPELSLCLVWLQRTAKRRKGQSESRRDIIK